MTGQSLEDIDSVSIQLGSPASGDTGSGDDIDVRQPTHYVSIQLGSPASGDKQQYKIYFQKLTPGFHSIGFPSEWGRATR